MSKIHHARICKQYGICQALQIPLWAHCGLCQAAFASSSEVYKVWGILKLAVDISLTSLWHWLWGCCRLLRADCLRCCSAAARSCTLQNFWELKRRSSIEKIDALWCVCISMSLWVSNPSCMLKSCNMYFTLLILVYCCMLHAFMFHSV